MSYARLHESFKNSDLHVKRNAVRDAVLTATGANRVSIHLATLDIAVCRGMYFSPRDNSHGLTCFENQHVIAVSRDLNRCWRRLVIVKELMHMLDGQDSATDSGVVFDQVLTEIWNPVTGSESLQAVAEFQAFWMALGLLAPATRRRELQPVWEADYANDPDTANYLAAKKLLIPAIYVPTVFSPLFERELNRILKI